MRYSPILAAVLAACASDAGHARRYTGTAIVQQVGLSHGDVTITNRNGMVWVDTAAAANQVSIVGRPFAMGNDDVAAEAAATAAMAGLQLQVTQDASGGVDIVGPGDDATGLDLTVHLPYPFAGLLTINVTTGFVHYVGSSGSRGATVNVGTGDIFVQDGGKTLAIAGGRSNVNVITLPTVAGTSITTSDGNITAQIPDSANVLITATSLSGGTVTPPPDRSVQIDDSSGDDTSSMSAGVVLMPLAFSTVSDDHRSAVIQLGDLMKIQLLQQYLTVSTGHGSIVFR
jgi:hypothetical protein